MSKNKVKKAAKKAAQQIKALQSPTKEQIANIYRKFQEYAHMP